MASIPFDIPELDDGFSEATGLLFLEEEFLVFDLVVKKFGLFEQPRETVKAEFAVIDHIRLERGIFKDKICIVPKRLELLRAIPGKHKAELRLKVSKAYRDDVLDLIDTVRAMKARPRTS